VIRTHIKAAFAAIWLTVGVACAVESPAARPESADQEGDIVFKRAVLVAEAERNEPLVLMSRPPPGYGESRPTIWQWTHPLGSPITFDPFSIQPVLDEAGEVLGFKIGALRRSSELRRRGVRNFDVILSINGLHASEVTDFKSLSYWLEAQSTFELEVLRGGSRQMIRFSREHPMMEPSRGAEPGWMLLAETLAGRPPCPADDRTGLRPAEKRLSHMPGHWPARVRHVLAPSGASGLQVSLHLTGKEFADAGFCSRDVITAVNGYRMSSAEAALDAYRDLSSSISFTVELERGGSTVVLWVFIPRT